MRRNNRVGALVLALSVVGCLLWSAAAWAASPPVATTEAASAVKTTTVVLNGVVDPEGSETTYYFEYGTSPCVATCGVRTPSRGPVTGVSGEAVEPFSVRRLRPDTTYHYWVVAVSAGGTVHGGEATFETLTGEEYVFSNNLEGYTFASLSGVGVNEATGDVYASDVGVSPPAIEQFDAAGVWQSSVKLPPVGGDWRLAVDNSGIPGQQGDVYVTDEAGNLVYKFDPAGSADPADEGSLVPDAVTPTIGAGVLSVPTGVAVGPNGGVYVASEGTGGSVAEFSPAGVLLNEHLITGLAVPEALAVDPTGNIYVATYFGTVEYTSAGVCVNACGSIDAPGEDWGVAVDPVGNVFVSGFRTGKILEYRSAAPHQLLENAALEEAGVPEGSFGFRLAVNGASRALYVAENGGSAVTVKVFTPVKVKQAVVVTGPAAPVGGLVEALNATVDPDGNEPTEYYFEYGIGPCDRVTGTCGAEVSEPGGVLLTGEASIPVSVRLDGLRANTTYHYWVVAGNERSDAVHGEERTFTTGPEGSSSKPPVETGPQERPGAAGGSSAVFPALGGIAPVAAPKSVVVSRSLTRAQRLARALKACARQPRGRRRVCERHARGRYGSVGKSKTASRKGGR
jgi:hypothetical protein